jgi:hypothetical protein
MSTTITDTQTQSVSRLKLRAAPVRNVKDLVLQDGKYRSRRIMLNHCRLRSHTSGLEQKIALSYADKAYHWVESFGLGFDRNDPATHTADKLHYFVKGTGAARDSCDGTD